MKKLKVLRHANGSRNIRRRPGTLTDVIRKNVPPSTARHLRRGHMAHGMREVNHIERESWEEEAARMQHLVERQKLDHHRRFYEALKRSRDMVDIVQERESQLQCANLNLDGSNAALQEANQELQAISETLDQANDKLIQSNRDLERFAAIISHDLQQPLRTVGSYAQLLQKRCQGQLDDKADEYIHHIMGGVTRMSELIQALLEYSRVSTRGRAF